MAVDLVRRRRTGAVRRIAVAAAAALTLVTAALAAAVAAPAASAAAPVIARTAAAPLTSKAYTAYSYGGYLNGEAFQDGLVSYHGYQYVVFYNSFGEVVVGRRAFTGAWVLATLADYRTTSTDAHNTISIGIDHRDGTIHLAFDMHASVLNYRRSRAGVATRPTAVTWNAGLFGPVTHSITGSDSKNLTYPMFVNGPDGALQMLIRTGGSGNGNSVLYSYAAKSWSVRPAFISGQGQRNAYPSGSPTAVRPCP